MESTDSVIGLLRDGAGVVSNGPPGSMAWLAKGLHRVRLSVAHICLQGFRTACLAGGFPSSMSCGGGRSGSRMSNAEPSRKLLRRDHRLRSPGRTGTANRVSWSQVHSGYAAGMDTAELPGQHMVASPHWVPAAMPCLLRYNRRGDLIMHASRGARPMCRLPFGQRYGLYLGFLLLKPKPATLLPL